MDEFYLKFLVRADLPEVVAIDEASFPDPWGEEGFVEKMKDRMAVGMVASDGAQALGYMVYSLRKRFIEVHRMAVHPDYRNRGIGRMMIERIESKLHCIKRSRAVFVVRESNLEGQLFLKRNGYKATGIEWGRYDQPEEPGYKFLLSPFDNNLLTNRITNYGDATDGRITAP